MLSKELRIAALSLSLKAQCGELPDEALNRCVLMAEGQLDPEHSFRLALTKFASDARAARRDPGSLWQLGKDLGRVLELHNRPDPVDLDRKDIHG